jgi:hypothetical protein
LKSRNPLPPSGIHHRANIEEISPLVCSDSHRLLSEQAGLASIQLPMIEFMHEFGSPNF